MWVIIAELKQSFLLPLFATAIPSCSETGIIVIDSQAEHLSRQIGAGIWVPFMPTNSIAFFP
jgi:hypothetical protein